MPLLRSPALSRLQLLLRRWRRLHFLHAAKFCAPFYAHGGSAAAKRMNGANAIGTGCQLARDKKKSVGLSVGRWSLLTVGWSFGGC